MQLFSVIIPAYNEATRISTSLEEITRYFDGREMDYEILVVNDGSTDHTSEVALGKEQAGSFCKSFQVLSNLENRGKGYCVRRGMLAAQGRYALMTDADLSTPIAEFEKLEKEVVQGGNDIAIGSRDIEGARVEIRQSWVRENAGKLFNRLVRALVNLPFRDTQCGFKLFDMGRCEALFRKQRIERFGFDVELLIAARHMGLSTVEIPVVWRHNSGSKIHLLRDGGRMLLDLARIRWYEFRGRYDS